MDKKEIIKKIEDSGKIRIKFAVTDIDGILRGKTIHRDKLLAGLESGMGFCDVIFGWDSEDLCYDNTELTGWHTGYPDAKALIDPDTFRQIPWEGSTPFFIADFSSDEKLAASACPRSLLKRIIDRGREMQVRPVFSMEFEWFSFLVTPSEFHDSGYRLPRPVSPGMFGYSVLRPALNHEWFEDLFNSLNRFDIPLESLHTETGPGAMEAAVIYDDILPAADKAVLFKSSVKEVAYRHGIMASFMARADQNLPGCGGHIHQSLWDQERKRNLFFDQVRGRSELMDHYIAGQLACLPEILPMYAPNVNSYKRLHSGNWAPSTLTWGRQNRTTAIRVIEGSNNSSRLEFRVPGADANPYLAMAASLASGLYGIRNKLKLETPETKGNGYLDTKNGKLPRTLLEATNNMAGSKVARELFGDDFVKHFIKTREWEWEQFTKQVTDWELKRYFEII